MDSQQTETAQRCLDAAHDGSLSFPEILGELDGAGLEGYLVDYRRDVQTFYSSDGDSVALEMPLTAGTVQAVFDAAEVERLVRWARSEDADYSYTAFSEQVKAAGCAGYLVTLLGRRVVYIGRTGETHIEHFPN